MFFEVDPLKKATTAFLYSILFADVLMNDPNTVNIQTGRREPENANPPTPHQGRSMIPAIVLAVLLITAMGTASYFVVAMLKNNPEKQQQEFLKGEIGDYKQQIETVQNEIESLKGHERELDSQIREADTELIRASEELTDIENKIGKRGAESPLLHISKSTMMLAHILPTHFPSSCSLLYFQASDNQAEVTNTQSQLGSNETVSGV